MFKSIMFAAMAATASASVHPSAKPVVAAPAPIITPLDAKDLLTMLSSSQVQGASIPRAEQLIIKLQQIMNSPPQKSKK